MVQSGNDKSLQRFEWTQGSGFLIGQERLFEEKKAYERPVVKGILPDRPWKLKFYIVTVEVGHRLIGKENTCR